MVAVMGYWRNIAAAALLMTLGSTVAVAGEPLVVSRLSDPESHLLALDGSPAEPSPEQRNASFINALAAATAAREQAIDAQCRTMTAVPASGEARMTWEAKCRYRRR